MKRTAKLVFTAAVSALALVSCTKDSVEELYVKQETMIESYVSSKTGADPDMKVTYNEGSVRLTLSEGDGMEVNARGKVTILYAGYDFTRGTMSKSTLFVTNSKDVALTNRWELTDDQCFEPVVLDLSDKSILPGLRNGLMGVREGEECVILFSGKYAFGKKKVGTISANAPLAYQVWVESIDN